MVANTHVVRQVLMLPGVGIGVAKDLDSFGITFCTPDKIVFTMVYLGKEPHVYSYERTWEETLDNLREAL